MKIVILHGWGHNGELWQNLANKLGKNAIAVDMPGFGTRSRTKPGMTDFSDWGVPEYAKWVDKKISKYKNVILIGHSFGGRVAAEIASKNPKYLKGLILSGSPNLYRPSLNTKIKIKTYKILKLFIPKNFRKLFYSGELREAGKLEKVFRKVVNYDQTKQIKKINIKTLLIWGEEDKDVPLRIAHEINSLIKQSELKINENTGHNSYLENPNLFFGYVQAFIKNISSR